MLITEPLIKRIVKRGGRKIIVIIEEMVIGYKNIRMIGLILVLVMLATEMIVPALALALVLRPLSVYRQMSLSRTDATNLSPHFSISSDLRYHSKLLSSEIGFDDTTNIDTRFIPSSVQDEVNLIRSLKLDLKDAQINELQAGQRYRYRVAQLLHHNATTGQMHVPTRYGKNQPLANWVMTQRMHWDNLDPRRRELLCHICFPRRIHPAWTTGYVTGLTPGWLEYLSRLKKFRAENGHVDVKQNYSCKDGVQLGKWVNNVRSQYMLRRRGEENERNRGIKAPKVVKYLMTDDRIARLEALGFNWSLRSLERQSNVDVAAYVEKEMVRIRSLAPLALTNNEILALPLKKRYRYRVAELLQYNATHGGDMYIPSRCRSDQSLSNWVMTQRRQKMYLPPERKKLLDSIDFPWQAKPSMYLVNSTKVTSIGAASVVDNCADDADGMINDRWTGITSNWLKYISALIRFKEVKGHLSVPQRYVCDDGLRLGMFVSTTRSNYRRRQQSERLSEDGSDGSDVRYTKYISNERIEQLDSIDFEWNMHRSAPTDKWLLNFERLRHFKEEQGHVRVPQNYVCDDGSRLGEWVSSQRRRYSLLRKDRSESESDQSVIKESLNLPSTHNIGDDQTILLLEEEGFLWDSHASQWMSKLDELKDYQAVHNNCLVPTGYKSNPPLATWVRVQRLNFKLHCKGEKSPITNEKIHELNKIRFEWVIPKCNPRRKKTTSTQETSIV